MEVSPTMNLEFFTSIASPNPCKIASVLSDDLFVYLSVLSVLWLAQHVCVCRSVHMSTLSVSVLLCQTRFNVSWWLASHGVLQVGGRCLVAGHDAEQLQASSESLPHVFEVLGSVLVWQRSWLPFVRGAGRDQGQAGQDP